VTLLDLLVIVIVAASVVAGLAAGFARVGIGLLALVCGVLFGFWFYGVPAAWVHKYVHSTPASNLLAFFLILFGCLMAGALLAKLVVKVFRWTGLSWLDRLMGAMFGLLRGALIVVALVAVLMAFAPKPLPNWMVNSKTLPYAVNASHTMAQAAPAGIKDAFRESLLEIRQAWVEQVRTVRKQLEPGRGAPKGDKEKAGGEKDKRDKDSSRKGKA
jgi:membrane protein required for colicin V production